ncbi:ferrochelatase [Legionella sp. km772]|uniref:ferrochelatase n=1 Tax=Legionella sp. km772 TaxID=2498111 RepID=UPI000F8F7B18|nr:ferrochelatase [Legionella sp. km772]RUR12257.1 ferrochelatase [Legionella sp. km772]
MKRGLLLINLGTPDAPKLSAVRKYLNEFLMDNRVIDLPWPLRCLLVKGIIIPFRTKKSAEAYQSIWVKEGSPLLANSQQLCEQLQKSLGDNYKVVLGMRYGKPSLASALAQLKECDELLIIPLYPQYSSAATGSALEEVCRLLAKQELIPSVKLINQFFQDSAYVQAQSELIRLHHPSTNHLLFSYHGIPERQLSKAGCEEICVAECPLEKNPSCYKAQCYQTSHLLAQHLNLTKHQYTTSFQSRLGKTPWIKPYTDEVLIKLAAQGVKNLTITCPSFVTDCLETLEEIGLRAKEQWHHLGGEQFVLVPAMNSHPLWVKTLKDISLQQPWAR